MKKTWWIILAVLVMLGISGMKKYVLPTEISQQKAIEVVKEKLDSKSIETIINLDNPKIKEIVFDTQPSMYYLEDETDIIGKELYKVTFNTTMDGLLGPMVLYVDKLTGTLIGVEYRY